MSGDTAIILACRPVEWSARTLGPGSKMPETPIYPDSTVDKCSLCATEIYVGPRLRATMSTMEPGDYLLLCFLCSLTTAGGPHEVRR